MLEKLYCCNVVDGGKTRVKFYTIIHLTVVIKRLCPRDARVEFCALHSNIMHCSRVIHPASKSSPQLSPSCDDCVRMVSFWRCFEQRPTRPACLYTSTHHRVVFRMQRVIFYLYTYIYIPTLVSRVKGVVIVIT